MKTHEIPFQGQKVLVEINDEITAGQLNSTLNACVRINILDLNDLRFNFDEYAVQLINKTITSKAFPTDPESIRKLPIETFLALQNLIALYYPGNRFLAGWLTLLNGPAPQASESNPTT